MIKTLTFVNHSGATTQTLEIKMFADGTALVSVYNTAEAGGPHKIQITAEELFQIRQNIPVSAA